MNSTQRSPEDFDCSTKPQETVRIVHFWSPPGVIRCVGVGTRCFIGLLEGGDVLKFPKVPTEACPELEAEVKIYEALGRHPYILDCVGWNGHGLQFPLRTSILHSIQDATEAQRRTWARQSAEAVAFVHERGVLHCDIHPNNVLLDSNNNVQLSDFQGVYKGTDGGALEAIRYSMPQDWNLDTHPSAKRDIFALGALLYWIMTGRHPHQDVADDQVEELFKQHNWPPTDFAIGEQIVKCWQQEYDQAGQLVSELEAAERFNEIDRKMDMNYEPW